MSTKKRGQNEDSIYKDGERWRGAVSLGYGPDGKRVRKKVSGKTRAEVVEKVRKLKETLAKGAPVPDDRLTIGVFLDRWLLHLPGHISDGTLDDYEDTVRLHLKPGLGRHKLTKLTVAQVDALWQANARPAIRRTASATCGPCSVRPWGKQSERASSCATSQHCRCLRTSP
ncbi:tyrosine-type recombinase/integrase [Nonomuraea sp. NPDC002799]